MISSATGHPPEAASTVGHSTLPIGTFRAELLVYGIECPPDGATASTRGRADGAQRRDGERPRAQRNKLAQVAAYFRQRKEQKATRHQWWRRKDR